MQLIYDPDNDGSHIKGLVINFFQHFWPHLLKLDGFLLQFVTPLVKIRDLTSKPLLLTSSSSSAASSSSALSANTANDTDESMEKGKKKKGKKGKPSLGQAINDPFVRSFYSLQEYEKYRRDQEQVSV